MVESGRVYISEKNQVIQKVMNMSCLEKTRRRSTFLKLEEI
jgi:hypothetical protein